MTQSTLRTAIVIAMALLIAASARAGILPPDAPVAGRSQADWADLWWQLVLGIPAPVNPIPDTSEAGSALGDQGSVFFLFGTTSGQPTVRNVTVRPDQHLFLGLINAITWREFSVYPDDLRRELREFLGIDEQGGVAPGTSLFVQLNGSDLPLPPPTSSLLDFRQVSPEPFDAFVTANNIFGLTDPIYPGVFPSVSDGWWLMIEPLAPGSHTLRIGGTIHSIGAFDGFTFSQDNTYLLTVVPEPSVGVLLGIGWLGLFVWRRPTSRGTARQTR